MIFKVINAVDTDLRLFFKVVNTRRCECETFCFGVDWPMYSILLCLKIQSEQLNIDLSGEFKHAVLLHSQLYFSVISLTFSVKYPHAPRDGINVPPSIKKNSTTFECIFLLI